MDNDTTMSSELRKEIERHTEDLKNNLGSHLEVSQKTHKALTWKVIIYLQKCLLTQNKHGDSTNDWRGNNTQWISAGKYFLGYKQLNTLNHPYYIHIQINGQETFHHSASFQYILFMKEKLRTCKQNKA